MKFIRTLSLLLLCVNFLNAQVSVLAKVDHLVPDGIDTIGNINLTVSGSTAPYTYTWNPGSISTKDISNVSKGSYTLNVNSASAQTYTNVYSLGYKVLWTNLSYAYFRNDSLVTTQTVASYATACSKNTLLPNTDGWFEYVIDALGSTSYYIGFTDSLSPFSHGNLDIDYGINFYSNGSQKILYYFENGTLNTLSTNPKIGDVIRVERSGNNIVYKINNVVIRTKSVSGISQKNLKLKTNMYYIPNWILNVGCSFTNLNNISFNNYVLVTPYIKHNSNSGTSNGSISLIPEIAGSYTYTWLPGGANTSSISGLSNGNYTVTVKDGLNNISSYQYSISNKAQWVNLDKSKIKNDTVSSTVSNINVLASAATNSTLKANNDGWFECVHTFTTNNYIYIGFTDSISPNSGGTNDIDFGITIGPNKCWYSWQNGTYVLLSPMKYGDIFRVERIGNRINYKLNGAIVRYVDVAGISQKTLKLKLNLQANQLGDIGCSFAKRDSISFSSFVKVTPTVKHNSAVGVNDGSINLKLKNGISSSYTWTPGSVISSSITSLANGIYSVIAQDSLSNKSNYKYEIGSKVQWTNLNRYLVNGDSLKSTSEDNFIYSNAVSKNTLLPNTDGWLEYPFEYVYYYYVGFTDSISSGLVNTDIDFGIYYFEQNKYLYYYENGTTNALSYQPNADDLIRIERIGNTINYKINGVIVRSVTNSNISQKTFKIKANLAGITGNTNHLVNVGCSFNKRDTIAFSNYIEVKPIIRHASNVASNDASIQLTPRLSGAHSYTWQTNNITSNSVTALSNGTYSVTIADGQLNRSTYNYNVGYKTLWKDFNQYCFFRNDSLISTAPSNNFGYACSKNVLSANTDGWFEYVIQDPMSNFYIGFIDNTSNNSTIYTDFNYGFSIIAINAKKYLYCNEVSGTTGIFYRPYRSGDVLRIERIGNTINYKINGVLLRTVTNANIGPKTFKLKAISYYQNKLANIGCSFTPLSANVLKEHAVYDSPNSAVAAIIPGGGKKPYTISWTELSGNESIKTGLKPGIYHALVRDSLNDTLTVPVYLGLKNNWRMQKNISVNEEVYATTVPDSAAALVSYNTIPSSTNGWTELTIADANQNSAFGFLGFASGEIDADYSVPLVKDQSLNDKLKYADSLLYNRFSGGQGNLSAAYGYLHLVSFKDGIVKIGFKGYTSSQVINYYKGDVFRMQREGDLIKLYQNNKLIASENFSSYNQQLLNSVFVLSGSSALRGLGGISSITDYSYASSPYFKCTEPNLNWVCSRSFDENGIIKSESKEYMDMLGRTIQSQTKLFSEDNVIVTEPLYDGYGRAIGQTLPAPSFNKNICYVPNFVEVNSNTAYTHRYFDNPVGVASPGNSATDAYNAPGDINHPLSVDNDTQGKLGWYYSDNNSVEPLVASDDYPYVRAEFYNDPTGRVKRSSGVGENHYMGSNHETKFIYTSTPAYSADPSTNELNYVFPYRTYELEKDFTLKPLVTGNLTHNLQLFKTISINPDGKDQITYTNSGGQTIATCITGDGSDCVEHDDVKQLYAPNFKKTIETIYIPKNKATTFKFYEKSAVGEIYTNVAPTLIDAQTGLALTIDTDFRYDDATGLITFLGNYENRSLHLQLGYSIVTPSYSLPNSINASVKVDYSQWTLYFYDRKGRLLGNAAPNDVTCLTIPYVAQRSSHSGDSPATCNKNNPIAKVDLNNEAIGAETKEIYLSVTHKLDTIFNLIFNDEAFSYQTPAQKRVADSLYFVANPPLAYNDSSVVIISDSAGVNNSYLDSMTVNYYSKIDSLNRYSPYYALRGKTISYSGNYQFYARLDNGQQVLLDMEEMPFEFDVQINEGDTSGTGPIVGKISGYKDGEITIGPVIPDHTEEILIKTANIKYNLNGYGSEDINPIFDPCNGVTFASATAQTIFGTINHAVHTSISAAVLADQGTPTPIKLASKYYWDEFDRLMASESEDEGRVDYVYDQLEDKLLFTQNDKQRANGGKFNCIVYDKLGRATITGEYNPLAVPRNGTEYVFQNYNDYYLNPVAVAGGLASIGTLALANNTTAYSDGRIFEKTFIEYDKADAQLPIDLANTNFKQKYTAAKVSKTYNDNSTTWYSYDELGRQKWSVSNSAELGFKTITYAYDFRGKLLQSIYQEGKTDNMYHAFSYDADERLKLAKWGRYTVGDGINMQDLAKYSYYLHGPLKRTVLGGDLQGLDYVYTIGGMLKSINNPMSNVTNLDPGMDGYATGPNANVSADAFSLMLQYYNNDYVRSGSVIKSYIYNSNFEPNNISYSGLIKNVAWHTKLPTGATDNYGNNPLMYEYNYNELYQLTGAQFGTVLPVTGLSQPTADFTNLPEYKLQNLSYDKNGNMQSLKRYAAPNGSGAAHLLDDLTYNYNSTLKNRLLNVNDASTNTGSYTAEFDLPNQTNSANYTYNQIGELTENKQENQGFEYNASGLTTRVYKLSNGNNIATFTYNDKGLRHSKISYSTGMVAIPVQATYYSYDAGGMLLATYTKDLIGGGGPVLNKDLTLYAAGRMGVYDHASNKALYELSDHLGNTRAVVSKNISTGLAETISYTDYYPHGGTMPGRNYVSSLGVPYAYQGIEKDAETNLLNFELRQYDARLGRWYNPDPMGQHHSPYLSMSNNPVSFTDPNGGWDTPSFIPVTNTEGSFDGPNSYANGDDAHRDNMFNSGGGHSFMNGDMDRGINEQQAGGLLNHDFIGYRADMHAIEKKMAALAKLGIKLEQTAAHPGEYGFWIDGTTRNGGVGSTKADGSGDKSILVLDAIGASATWQMVVKEVDLHRYRKFQEGVVGYFAHGMFDGIGEAVAGTILFVGRDAWKGETWSNMAKTLYLTSPMGATTSEGQALAKSFGDKIKNADVYDWGNFTGQAAASIIGTKGMGAIKTAVVANNGIKIGKLRFLTNKTSNGLTIFQKGEGKQFRIDFDTNKGLHYHRRGLNRSGQTIPGQGIGRHRPWESKSTDKGFLDRL